MATFSKINLSASSTGAPILISTTGSTGTTIHSTNSASTIIDEVYLYASNTATTQNNLTLFFGTTAQSIIAGIPPQSGLSLLIPGLPLIGNGSVSSTISAFATSANTISVTGFINRMQ